MYKILNNTSFSVQPQVKFPNPPHVHSPCVCKLYSHKLFHKFLCSTYLNSMEWPPPVIMHLFAYLQYCIRMLR